MRKLPNGRLRAVNVLLLVVATIMLLVQPVDANNGRVGWYADVKNPPARDKAMKLFDGMSYELDGGWSCLIGHTSKRMPTYEMRTTTCRKASDIFEFSVQCDRGRQRDHVQIRFVDSDGTIVDFIEVGCRLQGR
jgi:hypothetical protein